MPIFHLPILPLSDTTLTPGHRETSQAVATEAGALRFTSVGTNQFSAYNEWWVSWEGDCRNTYSNNCRGVKARVVRPNVECTNG